MQQNRINNIQIKITEGDSFQKVLNQNLPQQVQNDSKLKEQTPECKIQQNKSQILNLFQQNDDEKLKQQFFQQPNIQSIIQDSAEMFNKSSKDFTKKLSEHLPEYLEFFSAFELENSKNLKEFSKTEEKKPNIPDTSKKDQQKIRIKSQDQIKNILFQKGIYIQSISQTLSKKNDKFLQSMDNMKKQKKVYRQFNQKKSSQVNKTKTFKNEKNNDSEEIEDDEQDFPRWHYLQENLTSQYHVQKLLKHINQHGQFQSNDMEQNEIPKNQLQFIQQEFHQPQPQKNNREEYEQKSLNFKILEVRSTFSPQAFDIICSVGQIYILRISLLINMKDSEIHKHIIYSQGSYGNIYLLNGKINTQNQTQEFVPYQVKQNDFQSYSQFKNLNHEQINDFNSINKDFFVVKCFKLRENQNFNELLHSVLKQYCINCIMSALQIGPKVVRKFGFDLMVYEGCIQYCLQFCQNKKPFQEKKSQNELKTALLTMHQINLVHLDIKPQNIAFSRYFNRWIFLDFGFSDFTSENLGEKTFICYVGTYQYSSPEMKKALTSDSYVDLYFNDVYALKRSFIFMQKFQEIVSGNNSSIYYNHTFSLLLSVQIHQNFIKQALIITRLKYFLLREDLKRSCTYLKYLLRLSNDEKKNEIEKAYQMKNARKKIKKQVQQLFPLLMKQADSVSPCLPTIKQEKQEDWLNFQKSNLNLHFSNDQYTNYQKIHRECLNTDASSKKVKSSKTQIVRFYKSLLLTDFYVDFYYEHICYLIEDSFLHKQIQKKIKSNLIHNLVRFQSIEHQETVVLRKIKSKLFYRELKGQINQYQNQDQQQENINFDKLYALSLSINQSQYEQAFLAKKSIIHQNQGIVYWNQRAKARKGIMNLKQKLLDKKFLDNLSQEQYFNLYYRYVTFKKYIYKAKLSDKLAVSDFFIKYWKINHSQYRDFTKFFQEFITEDDIKDFPSNQTVSYSQNDKSNIKQSLQNEIERKNYKRKIVKNLQKSSPLYSLIICFRYIIVNCIYIQPSNHQKKQLFISLICQYFLIDDNIFTFQNDFNFLIAWYKIIIYHHCFFKNQEEKIQYLLKCNKSEDIEKLKKQTKIYQNFFELMQKLWRLNQADRILHYRIKPIKIKDIQAANFKNRIQFILKDRKILRNHFSSQVSIEKFLKILNIENFMHFHDRSKEFSQCFILEQDLKIIKSQILKNKNTNDRTKIYLIKLISLQLFSYDSFIQETAKVSQMITKQKQFILTQKLFQDIDFKTILKDEIVLLKASQFHYKESKVISNAKRIILQLASTPFSYKEIEEFHFHLTQRLRMQGKTFQSQSILKLIDRTINCKEISSNFLTSERRYFNYYIEKEQKKSVDLYQKSVNFFNPYQTFSNVDYLDDLITFSSIFVSEQSIRVSSKIKEMLTNKQKIQYTQNNQQFIAYKKFLQVQQIFVEKLKKYIKTVVLTLSSNMNLVSRSDYNNFFAILRQSLFFLKTQPPKSNLTALTSQNFFANYETKKNFFYQVFQKSLPFCQKYMHKISRNPIVRRYVYSITDQVKQFSKQFNLIKLEARSIRYFQQRKYLKTMSLIYQNLQKLGVRPFLKSQPVKLRMEHVRTLLLYVKAFFVHYRLKDHCWYEKYNYPEFVNLKIVYTKEELIGFIKKEGNTIDQSQKKFEIVYKQILKILYLFFVSTGDFLVAMQFNAPTLQFLIQTAKNVGDEKSYFQICLYLVSLSRFMSKNSLFKFTTYTIGNIEEFANKNISPITKPLFEYLIKFTQNILLHNYEQFSNQSKEWKNPHWWIFVNIFLKFSQINSSLIKKILLKIASVMQYLNSRLRQQITPLFYVNYMRFKDLQCFKDQISIKKLKYELLKLHKFQLKYNQNKIIIQHYIRLLVKSFCGMKPIIYHFQPRNNQQIPQTRKSYNMNPKKILIEEIQSDRIYFLCMRFEGFNRQLNSFYPLDTNFLNSQRKEQKDKEKNENDFSQNEQKAQSQFKKRPNFVRKPSISRSEKQDNDKKEETSPKPQIFNLSVSFNYEFKRKVQQIYCKLNGTQNFIQSQPQISPMKCKIINTIIQKIYVKQKNIENVHFQSNIQKNLDQKKQKNALNSKNNYVSGLDDLSEYP